jgi:hypothetical protein
VSRSATGTQGSRRNATLPIVLGVAIAVVGVSTLLGIPGWAILLGSAVPWFLVARARLGGVLAIIATVVGEGIVLLALLMLTAAAKLPMLATLEVAWTVMGVLGAWLLWRSFTRVLAPTRAALALAAPATFGGLVWFGVTIAARFIPGASRISWAMLGDSANNILLMRDVLRDHGIAVGAAENPVPLPTALFAVVSASGRGGVSSAALLPHDVGALTLTWSVLIAITCFAMGLTAGFLARRVGARALVVGLAAAGASLLPLSWFVTGYAIEFGFLDVVVAVPLVLLAFLAYVAGEGRAAVALALLTLSATLLLSVWSPLILIPAALGLLVVIAGWRDLLAVRGWKMALLVAGILQLLAYGLGVTLPTLLYLGAALATNGSVFEFFNWMTILLGIFAIAAGIIATRRRSRRALWGVIAVLAAGSAGVGVLLFVSRKQASPWTYYPVKFWWLCAIVLLVIGLGLAASAIARRIAPLWLQLVAMLVVAVATVAFLQWAPTAQPGYRSINPVLRVVNARALGTGDVVADRIFRYANPNHAVALWHSNDPWEGAINFWSWEMWVNTLKGGVALRTAAYGSYNDNHVSDLCNIVGLLGSPTTVYTTEKSLQGELHATCPQRTVSVIVQASK